MVDLKKEKPVKLKQIAELFDVNRRTVEAWIKQGLDAKRIGKLIYTTLEEVERFSKPVLAPCGNPIMAHEDRENIDAAERARKRFNL